MRSSVKECWEDDRVDFGRNVATGTQASGSDPLSFPRLLTDVAGLDVQAVARLRDADISSLRISVCFLLV